MKEIVSKKLCTGCTACYSICPIQAISMNESTDGFKYPNIDQDKCINCGLCKKTCPVINIKSNTSMNSCYVGYNKNEKVRLESSSGGIFSLIADYVLDHNGIVIGAAFDDENNLKHISIEKKKDMNKLRSSKYLQSDLDNIFKYIKDKVRDKLILFSGTPCQVAGLKTFIKNDYGNLICVDVICHGVPSPKLFAKYVKELEEINKSKLEKYNFRDKSTGWSNYSNTATFKGKEIKSLASTNPYMKLFLSDIALRESCYKCNFKLGNKYSDITLGDFWGVNSYYPKLNDNKGISCIIVNTERGKIIFSKMKNNMIFKECTIEEIISGNPSIKNSAKVPKNRNDFFNKDIDYYSIESLSKKYTPSGKILSKLKSKIKNIIKKYK